MKKKEMKPEDILKDIRLRMKFVIFGIVVAGYISLKLIGTNPTVSSIIILGILIWIVLLVFDIDMSKRLKSHLLDCYSVIKPRYKKWDDKKFDYSIDSTDGILLYPAYKLTFSKNKLKIIGYKNMGELWFESITSGYTWKDIIRLPKHVYDHLKKMDELRLLSKKQKQNIVFGYSNKEMHDNVPKTCKNDENQEEIKGGEEKN